MKKFLALLTALSLLAFAGSAFAVTVNATPSSVFVVVGTSATATVTGTAAHEGGTLTYEKTGGPAWAEFSGNTITFAPGSGVADNSYTVTITITETYLENPSAAGHSEPTQMTETATATVTATVYNIKPVTLAVSAPSVAVTAGTTTGTATLTGTAGNGGSVTYAIVAGPTWASLSGNTLTFTPGAEVAAGTYPITVRATESYTLLDGVARTATSSVVTVNVEVAAYVIPPAPVTSQDEEDTGSESTKTSEAAEAVDTKVVTKVVTTTTTETKTVTVQTFTDAAVAAAKVVTTVTKEETTQTVTQVTEKLKVTTTAESTAAANSVVETITQTTTTTTTTVTATEAATQFLTALTAPSSTGAEEDTSTKASKQAIATSLFKGKTTESGTTAAADTSFLTSKARAKADGTTETPAETFLRVLEDTLATAARVLTASNPTTAAKLQSMFTSTTTTTTTTTTVSVVDSTVLQNASVTNADGTETDEAPAFEDVMAQLAQQAQQEVDNTAEGTEASAKADTKLAEVQQEAPVTVTAPVSLPDDAEPSIAMINMPPQKPDMYGKRINFRALKQKKGSKFNTAVFTGAAIDAEEDGTGTFLNSIGQEIDTIPGEGEWGIPEGETEEQLIIPGQFSVAMLMQPGTVYTPVVTTPAEELATVEGVSTTAETKDVSVDVTTVEEKVVTVPVYDGATFSTSFDSELEEYFKLQGYDTEVGEFIVPGEDGVFSVASEADTAMLSRTSRAVVQTLPMIAPVGDTASDTAQYVMRVLYEIPLDTDTMAVSSADVVLAFWPNALTAVDDNGNVTTAVPGEALFLDETGRAFFTADMVRQVAQGELGVPSNDGKTQGYTGYIVMTLAKLSDDAEWYKPVITVKRESVTTPVPGPESGDQPGTESGDQPVTTTLSLSASASTIIMELGETETLTLSAANIEGTASYAVDAPAAAGVTLSGTRATITPTAVGSYTLRFTVTDSGRTTSNTATASVALTVTEEGGNSGGEVVSTVGSSGGGCDAGFGALALALLAGFIARKK